MLVGSLYSSRIFSTVSCGHILVSCYAVGVFACRRDVKLRVLFAARARFCRCRLLAQFSKPSAVRLSATNAIYTVAGVRVCS